MAAPSNPAEKKPSLDIYGAMMLVAALFLLIGTIFMGIELSRYGGFIDGYPWWETGSGK